jgi:hypothetical protein
VQLLTKEIQKKLPSQGSTEGQGKNAVAQVKFFTPDSNWTWYAVEYDPDAQVFYGLVDGFEKELGYFSLEELEEIRGQMGLPVERDKWFDPVPLRELM